MADENADDGFNEYGLQNLKHVIKTVVVNTTEMRKRFGINREQAMESIIWSEQNRQMDEVKK